MKQEEFSQEAFKLEMEGYNKTVQEALELLQSKDPNDKAKAMEKLSAIKDRMLETVFKLTDKLGIPRDSIEKIIANPSEFLSPEALKGLEAFKAFAKK
jgi:alanyl-tRNA synthetase